MALTKLQRHTAYILMLSEIEDHGADFLCEAAATIGVEGFEFGYGASWDSESFESVLPELYAKRPKHSGYCWFCHTNSGARINLLKECIYETHRS